MGNKWTKAHPKEMGELRERWRLAHPEKVKEHNRRSYDAHPERSAYRSAKVRCEDQTHKAYKWYGGRGIEFRFTSFGQFFAELGPRPPRLTLDRKDNDGHYEPGNVRWATRSEQEKNKRRKVNR